MSKLFQNWLGRANRKGEVVKVMDVPKKILGK
jgi:hypothetical protein